MTLKLTPPFDRQAEEFRRVVSNARVARQTVAQQAIQIAQLQLDADIERTWKRENESHAQAKVRRQAVEIQRLAEALDEAKKRISELEAQP